MPRSTHCKCGRPRTPENTLKSGYCKHCARAAQARFRTRNPGIERGKHFASKYGVSKEQFEAKRKEQDNKCAICSVELDYGNKATVPTLDHAHDGTNRFRGVLCHKCNTGLGLFRDNPEFLQSAIAYLKETQ